jgi:hypothetical protein
MLLGYPANRRNVYFSKGVMLDVYKYWRQWMAISSDKEDSMPIELPIWKPTIIAGIWYRRVLCQERVSDAEFSRLWQAYLTTPEWIIRRSLTFRRAGGTCERCRQISATQAHHLLYVHRFAEPLEDLMAVCERCHAFLSHMTNEQLRLF